MTVKVGLIGAGNISRAHRRHLKRIDDVAMVAICDVDRAKAAAAAAEWDARVFTDYRSMLDEVELDAVYICIPPFAHEAQEILAAEKGIALFVEKPIALHMDTAREADAAIREHGVISCVGFQGRYLDIIEKTQGLLASRPVGLAIGYWMGGLPGTYWWRRKQMSGGQAVEQTVHVTDMARYLFGDVKTVYAGGRTGLMTDVEDYDIEDASAATLIFENGTLATIFSACFLSCGHRGGLDIYTKDMVIEYKERKSITVVQGDRSEYIEVGNDYWQEMDNAFIAAVRTGDGSKLRCPYSDAVKTQQVVVAVNRSLETGEPVSVAEI